MQSKEEEAAKKKVYDEIHKEKNIAYRKAHRKEKAAYDKVHDLQRKYGITLEEKRVMYKQQSGCCAICNKRLTKSTDCHVDHCHETGMVRGLLCHKCNRGLGFFDDNFNILQNAIDYIRKNQ